MAGFKRKLLAAEDRHLKGITLAELADAKVDVFCWCNRCSHNAVLAAASLLAELGPDFPVPEATRPAWPSLGPVARHG